MTDEEIAAAVRKAAADYNAEAVRAKETLAGLSDEFNRLVGVASSRDIDVRVGDYGKDKHSVPGIPLIGDIRVWRTVKL